VAYRSKLEQEKGAWISLADVVRHVAAVEKDAPFEPSHPAMEEAKAIVASFMKLDEPLAPRLRAALQQIRWALNDGELPFRWGTGMPPSKSLSLMFPEVSGDFWLQATIDPTNGYAVSGNDPASRMLTGNYREPKWGWYVQLSRERVFQLWPLAPNKSAYGDSPKTTEQYKNLVRERAHKIYSDSQPNLREAEQIICRDTGIKRKIVRDVLCEDEFASRRKPAGNSRARSKL